jgi:hypothetical protein
MPITKHEHRTIKSGDHTHVAPEWRVVDLVFVTAKACSPESFNFGGAARAVMTHNVCWRGFIAPVRVE